MTESASIVLAATFDVTLPKTPVAVVLATNPHIPHPPSAAVTEGAAITSSAPPATDDITIFPQLRFVFVGSDRLPISRILVRKRSG